MRCNVMKFCTSGCVHAFMHVYMYACMRVCMYSCMHVWMDACMSVCRHVWLTIRIGSYAWSSDSLVDLAVCRLSCGHRHHLLGDVATGGRPLLAIPWRGQQRADAAFLAGRVAQPRPSVPIVGLVDAAGVAQRIARPLRELGTPASWSPRSWCGEALQSEIILVLYIYTYGYMHNSVIYMVRCIVLYIYMYA